MDKLKNIGKEKRSLHERGLHDRSWFQITLEDGTNVLEHSTNWSDISDASVVKRQGQDYHVHLCSLAASQILVQHNDSFIQMNVPGGCSVYQAVHAQVVFLPGGSQKNTITGRSVGIVKDGVVIQERIIDAESGHVIGYTI